MSLTFNFVFIKWYPSTAEPCTNGNILFFLMTESSVVIQNEKGNDSLYLYKDFSLHFNTMETRHWDKIFFFLSKYILGFQLYFLFYKIGF